MLNNLHIFGGIYNAQGFCSKGEELMRKLSEANQAVDNISRDSLYKKVMTMIGLDRSNGLKHVAAKSAHSALGAHFDFCDQCSNAKLTMIVGPIGRGAPQLGESRTQAE